MKIKPRVISILNAVSLDSSITDFSTFNLSELGAITDLEFQLPDNIRLGHLAEKIVSQLIKSSNNYKLLYKNIQIKAGGDTIGEIDFIIEKLNTKQVIHLELAYKFYLFDPNISRDTINNWIGPNRKDSLNEKLEKLKKKQFPLLYHNSTRQKLNDISIENTSQTLCLLASLFIPYEYKGSFSPAYEKAIKGYYLNFRSFFDLDNSAKTYHVPTKKEWGIDPEDNETWTNLNGVKQHIETSMAEKNALLCWQKGNETCTSFFIVWW